MVDDPEITEIVYNNFSIQERLKKVFCKTRCLQYFKVVLFIYDILGRSTSKYASVDIQSSPAYLSNSHSTLVRNQKATFCIQGQVLQNAENHKRFSSNSRRNGWESMQYLNLLYFCCLKRCPVLQGSSRTCQIESSRCKVLSHTITWLNLSQKPKNSSAPFNQQL